MATFRQAVPYTCIGSNSLFPKMENINYYQKWQYLDKSSSDMGVKSCQKWQKTFEQKFPILATEHTCMHTLEIFPYLHCGSTLLALWQ